MDSEEQNLWLFIFTSHFHASLNSQDAKTEANAAVRALRLAKAGTL